MGEMFESERSSTICTAVQAEDFHFPFVRCSVLKAQRIRGDALRSKIGTKCRTFSQVKCTGGMRELFE